MREHEGGGGGAACHSGVRDAEDHVTPQIQTATSNAALADASRLLVAAEHRYADAFSST